MQFRQIITVYCRGRPDTMTTIVDFWA